MGILKKQKKSNYLIRQVYVLDPTQLIVVIFCFNITFVIEYYKEN